MISRNEGLKLSLSALVHAIPDIINVIIIQFMFLTIFGIIGISFFKGEFFHCHLYEQNPENEDALVNVITVFDCLNEGGEWLNSDFNFDNIVNAVLTLFSISTTEGWVDTMHSAMSMVDIGY